jgi:hypothetical protein
MSHRTQGIVLLIALAALGAFYWYRGPLNIADPGDWKLIVVMLVGTWVFIWLLNRGGNR